MRKRKERNNGNALYLDAQGLAEILCCGRNKADEIGKAAGARVQFGGMVRYSVAKVDAYLQSLTEQGA